MRSKTILFRDAPVQEDTAGVREIVESSGYFTTQEIEVAQELVQERLEKGISSGYLFLFAETEGRVIGYACYGPVPCTLESYDLYWIAVAEDLRGAGVGRELLRKTEQAIERAGGRRIYVETSSREQYNPTRRFYRACGYGEAAVLEDFYAPGDHKVIYLKALLPSGEETGRSGPEGSASALP